MEADVQKALQLRFKLYGFPADWFNITFNDTGLAQPEAERLKNLFSKVRSNSVCYVQGTAAPIVNQFIESGVVVRGVDASIYIADPFDKDEKKGIPDAEVIVFYNCTDGTTQINLVQKVIKKLVNSSTGAMVILVGDITGRAFAKDYFHVANHCIIQPKAEEKWL